LQSLSLLQANSLECRLTEQLVDSDPSPMIATTATTATTAPGFITDLPGS
jgi:hypothetical protein